MLDQHKKRAAIGIIGALLVAYPLWNSDMFQRAVFPARYWTQEVEALERLLEIDEWFVQDTGFEIAKLRATARIRVAQAMALTRMAGGDEESSRKFEQTMIETELEQLQADWDRGRDQVDEAREQLREARRMLSVHAGDGASRRP